MNWGQANKIACLFFLLGTGGIGYLMECVDGAAP